MPRDRTFIIDSLPEHPQISLCVGAGHAFKFASLFGQILSHLAVDGRTPHDISSLTLNRPAITDPEYDSPILNQIRARGY
jgi:sarcosine oxidase